MDLPRGPVLAVDAGSVRTGVALSDPDRTIATPLVTVPVTPDDPAAAARAAAEVAGLAAEHGAVLVVVGLPLSLSGAEGPAALKAREFARALAALVAIPVRMVDERFTTATAQANLRQAGRTGRRGRSARAVVDQAAAVVLLQHVLDAGRSGVVLGEEAGAA